MHSCVVVGTMVSSAVAGKPAAQGNQIPMEHACERALVTQTSSLGNPKGLSSVISLAGSAASEWQEQKPVVR